MIPGNFDFMSWESKFEEVWQETPDRVPEEVRGVAQEYLKESRRSEELITELEIFGAITAHALDLKSYVTPHDYTEGDEINEVSEAVSMAFDCSGSVERWKPNPAVHVPQIIEGNYFDFEGGLEERDERERELIWKKTYSILNEADEENYFCERHQEGVAPRSIAAGAVFNAGKEVTEYLKTDFMNVSEVMESSTKSRSTVLNHGEELRERGYTGLQVPKLDKLNEN